MAIQIKSQEEIAKMRIAGQLACDVLEMIAPHVKAGITTDELNTLCAEYTEKVQNAISAPLNYHGFPKSICTSVNYVVCHGIPDSTKLIDGDIINIDITVIKDGYHGDTSKMFFIGEATAPLQRLVDITQESMYKAIALVKPGCRLGDIGAIIQQHAESNHYSIVREYCGHGIGSEFHEDGFQVLHYGKAGTGMELLPGMTFTIEPMVNQGKRFNKQLPDGWTVVTKDRKPSAQFEHTCLVTEDGVDVLTRRKEETQFW